jgi:hypothetical protein
MRLAPSIPLACLAAVALAIAGCGTGGRDDASTAARTAVRHADAVCADLAHRRDAVQTLAAGARPEATARAYAALAELTVDRSAALERTVAPAPASAALRRYLAAVHREASLGWSVRRALAEGDLPRAKRLVEQASAASASTRALARAAGLRVCGERA